MLNFLIEIKNRFILLTVTALSVFVTGYCYKNFLLILVIVSNIKLSNDILNYFIFTSITELFVIYIMLCFFLVIQIVYYTIFYQLICFLAPGLYKKEYVFVKLIFFATILLGMLSIYFFQNYLVPLVSSFFLSFQNYSIKTISFYFEAKIYEYLVFYKDLYLSCFLIFQSCIFLILLTSYTSNNLVILKISRKFIYIILLIFSTLITPPDIFSQLFLFLSLLVGFEMLVFINILKTFLIR